MSDTWEFKIDDDTLVWLEHLAKHRHNDICLNDCDSAQIILLMLKQKSDMERFVNDMRWKVNMLLGIIKEHLAPEEMRPEEQRCYEKCMATKEAREKARLTWADRNASSDTCLDHWLSIHDKDEYLNTAQILKLDMPRFKANIETKDGGSSEICDVIDFFRGVIHDGQDHLRFTSSSGRGYDVPCADIRRVTMEPQEQ